jgi:hypothetical protein
LDSEERKKLEHYLENLEKSQSDEWKKVIDHNKEEFNQIKQEIREKQNELSLLVKKKKALIIASDEFEKKSSKIQEELYELESRILRLRIQSIK